MYLLETDQGRPFLSLERMDTNLKVSQGSTDLEFQSKYFA